MTKRERPKFALQSEARTGIEWELMFLGKLHPAEPGGSQHLVDVIFAARNEVSDSEKTKFVFDTCRRGVGELPNLVPGTVWEDEINERGQPVRALKRLPASISREAKSYQLIDPSKARTLTLDTKLSQANYKADLIVAALEFYKGLKIALIYAKDPSSGAHRVLYVPQIEIFRYALCKTPRLVRSLFHVTNDPVADFQEIREVDNRRIAVLTSAAKLNDIEAIVIASINTVPTMRSLSESGFAAAAKCLSSRGDKIVNGHFLVCTPYWSANTKLHAYEKLIKLGVDDKIGGFVQLLIDDDMRNPFDEVEVLEHKFETVRPDSSGDGQSGGSSSGNSSGVIVDPKLGPENEHPATEYVVEIPAGVFTKAHVPVSRVPVVYGEHESRRPIRSKNPQPVDTSLGEPIGRDPNVKDATVNQIPATNGDGLDSLRDLWEAALLLEKENRGWTVEAVTSSNPSKLTVGDGKRTAVLSLFPLTNGKLPKWACVRRGEDLYSRLALIVRFEHRGRYAYTIDMQRLTNKGGFFILTYSEIERPKVGPATIDDILNEAAKHKGVWSNSEFLKSRCSIARTKHMKNRLSAKDLASAIKPHLAIKL